MQAQPCAGVLGDGHIGERDRPVVMVDGFRAGVAADGYIGEGQLHLRLDCPAV